MEVRVFVGIYRFSINAYGKWSGISSTCKIQLHDSTLLLRTPEHEQFLQLLVLLGYVTTLQRSARNLNISGNIWKQICYSYCCCQYQLYSSQSPCIVPPPCTTRGVMMTKFIFARVPFKSKQQIFCCHLSVFILEVSSKKSQFTHQLSIVIKII